MAVPEHDPIAVIGMACRFPGGADSPSKLWNLLRSPTDLTKRVPVDRFDVTGFYHANGSQHGATDATRAYFLEEDVNRFDNTFFNIQPAEAEAIDPQQRLLLETVYDSLCAGGQTIENLRGSNTAVFVGQMCDDWSQVIHRDWDLLPTYAATGTSRAIISNRVSYFFDWHGPSTTIDTACSSSLVAVHQGVAALRNGECPIAIAAGANLIVAPGTFIAESNLHMLSPTGSSKMWDAGADGYARGEGIAAVVLKPLSAALRDGDHIDCIIRETAVNQDGKTAGLTMPSNVAQTNLIRDTYIRAGLDINDPQDRPQFFHAHGTGTPAGDPQEAEAISRSFFQGSKANEKLYVGSIKTVIGHTEGSAGLASLIGSALAMQNGIIPPNLHFTNLSPRVAPFYTNLEIPTTAVPWPEIPPGQPRRVSVNSFGFGGTNAHAILEYYNPDELTEKVRPANAAAAASTPIFSPLAISAASSSSLRATLKDLKAYLSTYPDTSIRDLAYTLQARRSTLAFRKPIVAATPEKIVKTIDGLLSDSNDKSLSTRYYDVSNPRILGVFTGQGAQWPRMGAKLLEESPFVAQRIAELQRALSTLPDGDRPSWTLYSQLVADSGKSRLAEAAIAQPLCTAVQIVLVDLLKAAGIHLSAVVGHSSGEIGAAYAAGFLSSTDAIRVAYYRGLYAKLASSPSGAKGAMMAVGTSFEDAQAFCELGDVAGRIRVAARNSPSSITLSGDDDAVEEALAIFKDEGKFARALRVDTAYHSNHMLPCVKPYLDGLTRAGYSVGDGNGTTWFSSVIQGGHAIAKETVQDPQYWADNMTGTVLFEPAVKQAVAEAGPFDIAIEFGPHPALKGPALDTIEQAAGRQIPYTGLLSRSKDDVTELSAALGYLWMHLGASSVKFDAFETLASASTQPKRVVAGLPTYPFDHSRAFGSLTRFSGSYQNAHTPPHPLLGRRLVETETVNEISWRNVLRSSENSWLQGHALQGQTVFPATGYISVGVEAIAVVARDTSRDLGLITLEDVVIGRALAFSDDNSGMETKVTLSISQLTDDELSARTNIYSGLPSDAATPLALNFTATVKAAFHKPQPDTLPATRRGEELNLVHVELERLYSQFTKLGYNYTAPFTGVRSLQRKLGWAIGELEDESGNAWEDKLLLHPGWLDSSIQTGSAAYSHPHDNRLFALFVPTAIRSVVINPNFFDTTASRNRTLHFQTAARAGPPETPMVLDIDIFSGGSGETAQTHPFVQFDSINMRPFATPTSRDDAVVFARFKYRLAEPDADLAVKGEELVPPEINALWRTFDRVGFYYLRRLYETITPAEKAAALPHFQHLLDYAGRLVASVTSGKNPVIPQEAATDSSAFIRSLIAKHHDRSDMQMVETVGEHMVSELRRNGSLLEHMMKDGLLDRFYAETAGVVATNFWIARIVAQIAHRYPRMNLFEVGAGTGSTTRPVLAALDGAFSSYTFTDIGAGFLSRAQERFAEFEFVDRLNFATFDVEQPADGQGFEPGSYDIVIASNVLHATGDLENTLANVRGLLKPGGYLIALEIVSEHPVGINSVMGAVPGWWAGAAAGDPSRQDGPCLTLEQWDALTRRCGFGGIDTHTPVADNIQWFSVWVAQAVDDRVVNLRTPLAASVPRIQSSTGQLLVVGGRQPAVAQLAEDASILLSSRYRSVIRLESLEDLNTQGLTSGSAVLSLVELDEQLLEIRSESKINALKTLWRNGGDILWVSRGARNEKPFSSIMLGLARVVAVEYPKINLQVLDFDAATEPTPQLVAEALIRLELNAQFEKDAVKDDLLWTMEPETHFSDGRLHIPRLCPDAPANKRYNSYRRTVTHEVDVRDGNSPVVLEPAPSGQDFLELATPSPLRVLPSVPPSASGKIATLHVEQSLLQVVKVQEAGYLALVAGVDVDIAGKKVIALVATTVESRSSTPAEWTVSVPSNLSTKDIAASLASIGSQLLAQSILAAAPRFGTVLVHEADELLKSALDQAATKEGVRVVFTTAAKRSSNTAGNGSSPYIFVHAKLPARLVRTVLPRDVSFLVDLSCGSDSAAGDSADLIVRSLPQQIARIRRADILRTQPSLSPNADLNIEHVCRLLRTAWQEVSNRRRAGFFLPSSLLSSEHVPLLSLQEAAGTPVVDRSLSIVDWTASSLVHTVVRGIDHGTIFRADGTYFLVGLAGDMGQSLCSWMVAHGARNVVLGSRRPKVDPRFIESLAGEGATVKVVAVDVTSRESLRAAHNEIRAELPPVIGVANGAMLLEDSLFDDLDFASLERTAPPKIDGSVLLDELFYDDPLDFFILFTSTAQVVGNGGQSAYVMANQFMAALAAQRRDVRGVAGSNMAIGSVYGLGYFQHADHLASDHFTRLSYRNISEQDLHELFAEAVLAGRPTSKGHGISEMVSGISPFQDSPETHPQLRNSPRFSHLLMHDAGVHGRHGAGAGSGKAEPLRARLANAKSHAEAQAIVREAFIGRLKGILMIPQSESINDKVTFVEQGIDSIMAVEVRTWFLQELNVDLPVLKILGAQSTVDSLLEEAVVKIPIDILNLDKVEGSSRPGGDGAGIVQATASRIPDSASAQVPTPVSTAVLAVDAQDPLTKESTEASNSSSGNRSPGLTSTPQSPAETPLETPLERSIEDHEHKRQLSEALQVQQEETRRKSIMDSAAEVTEEMTYGQKRFWFLNHYIDDPTTFNITYCARLEGSLRVQDLARAVETAAERHEALRTRFFWSDDGTQTPMQGILSKSLVHLETATISSEAQVVAEVDAMRDYKWNLGDWVQVRLRLLTLSDNIHYLIMGTPHISMDGHSMSMLMLDINQAYLHPSRLLPVLPTALQVRAFGKQQILAHKAGKFQSAIDYYRHALQGLDLSRPVEPLSFARSQVRMPLERYVNNVARARLDPAVARTLKQVARAHQATSFHTYLAALQALLFRLLPAESTDKLAIGIADANRLDSKFIGSIGNFLNVLPLLFNRTTAAGAVHNFGQAVEDARQRVYGALEHSALPFDLLLDELAVPRSNAHPPIFQVFMDYKLVTREQSYMSWADTKLGEQRWYPAKSPYDIAVEIVEDHESALVTLHTQDALYSQDATDLLLRSYINLLSEVTRHGGDKLSIDKLAKWDPVDVEKALKLGRGPDLPFEWPSTVAHRIDQVIAQHPENIAVKDGFGHVLTYAALDQRVESIASAIRLRLPDQGRDQSVIGVFQAPAADWIASLLAIFRVGAVYLPLDLKVSLPRLKGYVKAARPAVVLADNQTSELSQEIGVEDPTTLINVSELPAAIEGGGRSDRIATAAQPDRAAYIIFTSGSTGEPKGVVIKHASFHALAEGFVRQWDIATLGRVVLQQFPLTSDGSLKQIISALTTGGTLVVASADARGDPNEITRLMAEHSVTFAVATPSEWGMWFRFAPDNLRRCTSLTSAWFGGERAPQSLLESFRDLGKVVPNLRFFNTYGPTEATISTVKGEVDAQEWTVPVPSHILPNYAVYIVDDHFQPVPVGVPGEIVIGGAGVGTNEYLNQPNLTATQFPADTFTPPDKQRIKGLNRVYRSGDYGRLDAHGRLTIEGRVAGDAQVKVRGFRVELGEIEEVLVREAQGAVVQAVVTLFDSSADGDSLLVAHVVTTNSKARGQTSEIIDRLRERLIAVLPQYMVPAVIVPIDALPLTAHGKIDRKAVQLLPLPEIPSTTEAHRNLRQEPLSLTERRLADIWTAVLPASSIAANPIRASSNFFHLGGNSLLLVKLQSVIKRAVGDAPRLGKLMNTPDLASMAALLEIEGDIPDWDKEIKLESDLLDAVPAGPRAVTAGIRVLVTGATGSLGKQILPLLAADQRVSRIIALVRPAENRDLASLFTHLENSNKVHIVSAELPSLPTDNVELGDLDAILHTAADRNFWDGYGALKPVNVTAGKKLARLALDTGAVLHVLSSGALADYEADGDDNKGALPRPDPADGYVSSKWVTERYLANAERRTGLRVVAHRPTRSFVPADHQSESMPEDKPTESEEALVSHALLLSPKLGVRPNFSRIGGTFHIAPIADVATAIATAVAQTSPLQGSGDGRKLEIVNYPGTASIRAEIVGAHLEELLKQPMYETLRKLPAIPALHWVGRAKRAGLFEWFFTAQELVVTDEHGHSAVSRR